MDEVGGHAAGSVRIVLCTIRIPPTPQPFRLREQHNMIRNFTLRIALLVLSASPVMAAGSAPGGFAQRDRDGRDIR
jgi:hypothetical protein